MNALASGHHLAVGWLPGIETDLRLAIEAILIFSLVSAFLYVYSRQRGLIYTARKEREDIKVEETRVFDFLHGLGEAFSDDIRTTELHRLIVESAVRILDAHGGALYLTDKAGLQLMPAFISQGCAPLVEVPAHILSQPEAATAVESFIRLHAVRKGEGLLGRMLENQQALFIPHAASHPEASGLHAIAGSAASMLVAPLTYSGQMLGVLAVINDTKNDRFSPGDFEVFKSIAEQSAFALYNAVIYYEANEKKRMDHDLTIARDIQRILLPACSPQIAGFEISGLNLPARHVSGDYFDYIKVEEGRLGVAIADVSGKGVPASLIMAMCRSVLRSQAAGNFSAADVLHKVNKQLFPDIKEDMFISMAYIILSEAQPEIILARAGHDAPLHYSAATKTIRRINPPGMALGIDSGSVFDRVTGDFQVVLEPGDCLILYTDGVNEALDNQGNEYGMERLKNAILASAPQGAQAILRQLTDEVREFAGSTPQNDDITLIAIRKL